MAKATRAAGEPRGSNTPFPRQARFTFSFSVGQENLTYLREGKRVMGRCMYDFNLKVSSATSWILMNKTLIRSTDVMPHGGISKLNLVPEA